MPENQIQTPKKEPAELEMRKTAIRTMKTDAEELFKTAKPSLLDLVNRETGAESVATKRKIEPFYFIVAVIIVTLGAMAGLLYFIPASVPVLPRANPPVPFFATESSRAANIDADNRAAFIKILEDSNNEIDRPGTFKRIIVKLKDGPNERYADLNDFSDFLRMNPPPGVFQHVNSPVMIFLYSSQDGNRFGFAVKTNDPDRVFIDMLNWEASLLLDMRPLFIDAKPATSIAPFEDRTYRNIDWRFQKLSADKDIGIGYLVFPARNLLVVATSRELMETVINRLYATR